jgi:LemA protein
VEQYPELKASENFQNVQSELKRTEDIIAVYREEYNKAVLQFNTLIQTFPNVLVATIFAFRPYMFFQASMSPDNKLSV